MCRCVLVAICNARGKLDQFVVGCQCKPSGLATGNGPDPPMVTANSWSKTTLVVAE